MLPLRDHNPPRKFPILTYLLILINVLVFLYMFSLHQKQLESFIFKFALIPNLVLKGENLYAFLSSIFLHASFGHLFSNMLFLHIFGDNLEAKLGRLKYLIFYFVCGFFASISEILIHPFSKIPMLGASGAIAGLMGGYLCFFPKNKIDVLFSFGWHFRILTLPAWTMLIYWLFYQLLFGLGTLALPFSGGIAYFAHIGGFLAGFLLAKFSKK